MAAGTTTAGSAAVDRLRKAEAELAAERARTNRSTLLTFVIGALLLGLLAYYFYYGYTRFSEVAKPQLLVDVAEQWVNDQVPEVRKNAEAEIIKSAPTWAKTLSQQAIDNIPTVRERMEDYIVEQVEKEVAKSITLSAEHVKGTVQKNKPELQKLFNDLAESDQPEMTEAQLEILEKMLDQELGTDMKDQSSQLLEALSAVNKQLSTLREGKGLSEEDARKRRVLLIFRRIQAKQGTGGAPPTTVPLYDNVVTQPRSPGSVKTKAGEAALAKEDDHPKAAPEKKDAPPSDADKSSGEPAKSDAVVKVERPKPGEAGKTPAKSKLGKADEIETEKPEPPKDAPKPEEPAKEKP
jgi:hypothetical protein